MKNLKVWQKLTVIGLVWSMPLVAVLYVWSTSIRQLHIDSARQERLGIDYETPVMALLQQLQQHRDLATAAAAGSSPSRDRLAAKATEIEGALGAVDGVHRQTDDVLRTGVRWNALRGGIVALVGDRAARAPEETYAAHTQLIGDLLAYAVEIADASYLTLDPDLDSFYLMTAATVLAPELAEALSQARALGMRAAPAPVGVAPPLEETAARAEYLAQRLATALDKAMAANGEVRTRLEAHAAETAVAAREAIDRIRRPAASRQGDPEEFFGAMTRAIDRVFATQAQTASALTRLLDLRIERFQRRILFTLLLGALGVLLASIVAHVITLDITRPLKRVVAIAREIAGGDLSVNVVSEQRRDEIGELATEFDHMVAFLRETVHIAEQIAEGNLAVEVRPQSDHDLIGQAQAGMVTSLSALVGQVQKSGIQVASSVNEIAATAKQQQATASEIAATTLQIGATSKEISATAKELVNTVSEVSKVAEDAATLAGSGQTGLTQMEETMRQVVEAAGSINSRLAVLNEKAGNISQVVTTISKVADQTNLLSLNAAIEAEKAGEYGRGFAVVATEIRRLADQTAVATYDIDQMVKEIQSAVSAGVMGMDKFSEEVRRGMQDIQQVGGQLSQIIAQVQALAPRFEAVDEGMQAQSTGAEQITQALTQLNEAAQQTVESLRQSSQAIDGLNEVSGGLRSGVSRFKLRS